MAPVLLSVSNGVATITLNRPDKLNAFNREMALLLQNLLDQCHTDIAIRCVLLTGAGKAFCAGQDLAELVGENPPSMQQILSEHYNPIVTRIRQMPKPVVAAINGVAAGAGANIALCADIVVATETASFIQAFSKIGLIPDSGGTYLLPRLIGWQKASALAMLGDKVSAAEAEKMGMIYKCFTQEDFESSIQKMATQLAQMPTQGLALTKQALNASFTNTYEAQLALEDVLQQQAAQTQDYNEGVQAFLEKRLPTFKGY
ncbi:MAG: 2-(1,2-epoxy-1,2-dihydrophenyl)acetyl-CoA isomerase [Sphingobacteriales bacterium]|nr:MAG: 2-(1,2-epoxy-1,2-dihydrophenyl)acetyl-CoA isomerase [Sphingobacteriales bacterium]